MEEQYVELLKQVQLLFNLVKIMSGALTGTLAVVVFVARWMWRQESDSKRAGEEIASIKQAMEKSDRKVEDLSNSVVDLKSDMRLFSTLVERLEKIVDKLNK